jgi:hypothetical protein
MDYWIDGLGQVAEPVVCGALAFKRFDESKQLVFHFVMQLVKRLKVFI